MPIKAFLGFAVATYKNTSYNLAGPVKDTERLASALLQHHGYDRIITKVNESATSRTFPKIARELRDELPDGSALTVLWSGHGTRYVTVENGKRRLRQAIVPWDYDGTASTLIDGRALRDALTPPPGRNLHVSVILDSCFSGGVLRAVPGPGLLPEKPKALVSPSTLASTNTADPNLTPRTIGMTLAVASARIITLSACQDDQVAMDTALPTEGAGGAFTFALLAALRTGPPVQNTWAGVVQEAWSWLKAHDFEQDPNLAGPPWKFNDRAFVLAGAAPVHPAPRPNGT